MTVCLVTREGCINHVGLFVALSNLVATSLRLPVMICMIVPHVPSHAPTRRDVVTVCVKVLEVSNATLVRRNVSGNVNIIR